MFITYTEIVNIAYLDAKSGIFGEITDQEEQQAERIACGCL